MKQYLFLSAKHDGFALITKTYALFFLMVLAFDGYNNYSSTIVSWAETSDYVLGYLLTLLFISLTFWAFTLRNRIQIKPVSLCIIMTFLVIGRIFYDQEALPNFWQGIEEYKFYTDLIIIISLIYLSKLTHSNRQEII